MAFCDIQFKRKQDGTIEVKNKRGEQSPLYSKLVEYTNQNNVYQGREWFFDKLVEQGKLKSLDTYDYEKEVIERNINDHNFNGFIINIKTDNKIVGSIQINTSSKGFEVNGELFAEVRNVSTDPSIRGKGYGKILYALAFEELNKRGFAGFGNFGELVLDKNVFKIRESLITEKVIYDGDESVIYRGFKENKNPLQKSNTTFSNYELSLGLYSIAFNSDRSEGYWMSKIEELLPQQILADRSTDIQTSDITEKGFTNAKQYVEYIANNNEPLSPLARKLLSFNSNVPVLVTENPDSQVSAKYGKTIGVFDPNKNEIRIIPNAASNIILHEQIHAITYNWLKNNPNHPQVKELVRLMDFTKAHIDKIKQTYPLENLDEFITGIFTNSQFIYDLQHIPYKSTSVLTELLKWFSDLFRFTPKQETLFEEVFFRAEELLDTIKEEEIGFELLEDYDLENDYKSILSKYGNVKTSEIRPQSDWGKLVSDVAKVNKKYKGKVITLYQAPNSKWYLKQIQDNNSPLFNSIPNHRQIAMLNSQEMNVRLGEMGEDIVDNWNQYFDEYDFLSESEKRQYASLIEEGQVQIQCKF